MGGGALSSPCNTLVNRALCTGKAHPHLSVYTLGKNIWENAHCPDDNNFIPRKTFSARKSWNLCTKGHLFIAELFDNLKTTNQILKETNKKPNAYEQQQQKNG